MKKLTKNQIYLLIGSLITRKEKVFKLAEKYRKQKKSTWYELYSKEFVELSELESLLLKNINN